MMHFFIALVVSLGSGYLMCRLILPRHEGSYRYGVFIAAVSAGCGFGLTSIVFFIAYAFSFNLSGLNYIAFDFLFSISLVALSFFAFKTINKDGAAGSFYTIPSEPISIRSKHLPILILVGFACLLSSVSFIFISLQEPHGGWDAWLIWNTKAKVLSHPWTDTFMKIGGHPDYPLLIPASIARLWIYKGSIGTIASIGFHFSITFCTILLLASSLSICRDLRSGLIAGLVLLGTPYFIREGAAQQADVTFSFFILATIVLFAMNDKVSDGFSGFSFVAGMSAGFAAWTKNEGLLFVICIIVARSFALTFRLGWRRSFQNMKPFFMALVPVLSIVAYYKLQFAPPNDLVSGQGLDVTTQRLLSPIRYYETARFFISYLISFDRWEIYPIALILLLFVSGIDREMTRRFSFKTAGIAVLLILGGYFFVYIATPNDLIWHLETSLPRLILQLWPTILFSTFLMIRA